jgi:hypothetical protein
MNTITAGVIAMMTDQHNHGRMVHVDAPHPAHPGAWHVTSLQTVTLSPLGAAYPIADYPAGTRFATPGRWLRPFGGLDATEEASNALPNVMAPRRQVEFSR